MTNKHVFLFSKHFTSKYVLLQKLNRELCFNKQSSEAHFFKIQELQRKREVLFLIQIHFQCLSLEPFPNLPGTLSLDNNK